VNGRQRSLRLKLTTEFNSKLLDRIGSVKDFNDFLQTEGGVKFMDSLTVERSSSRPQDSILRATQIGIVLIMLGLGVLALGLHVGFTWAFPPSANLPVLVATASSVLIATVGARELARSRRAEFQGRHAQAELANARSDFVAMLTHDIRNPMAVIDGYVEMLLAERDLTPKARDELLIQVQRAARTALELAGEFLDASKIEAGRFVLKPTRTVDVDDVLRRVLGDHRSHATQRGIALWHDEAPDLPAIEADAAALTRVFANLIGNAIKHTAAGGSVRVVARRVGSERIEIVVEDTGEGLPPGMEARVFDRYTGVATRADSTGLGLFIASTITAAHGGTIAAENRSDRRGARSSEDR